MQFTGLHIVGFVLLLAAVALCTIGLATDNWAVGTGYRMGLYRSCLGGEQDFEDAVAAIDSPAKTPVTCTNKFSNLFDSEKDAQKALEKLNNYEISVFSMMLIAAVIGLLALVTSPCCCTRCGGVLSSFVFIAFLSGAAAICTYAWYAKKEHEYDFGWSYWVSLGGVVGLLLAEMCFAAARVRSGPYAHYSHAI